jgi:hypothetical protein
VRRHEVALRRLLDVDEDLRRAAGLRPAAGR